MTRRHLIKTTHLGDSPYGGGLRIDINAIPPRWGRMNINPVNQNAGYLPNLELAETKTGPHAGELANERQIPPILFVAEAVASFAALGGENKTVKRRGSKQK
jgi:hypothetical protein